MSVIQDSMEDHSMNPLPAISNESTRDTLHDEQDFQDPIVKAIKRQKIDHDDYAGNSSVKDSNEFATTCPLCQEKWTNSGPHVIVSLRCGHLFGQSRHISLGRHKSNVKGTASKCPTCGEPAKKNHIRSVWPNKVIPQDPDELKSLKEEINALQEIIEFQEKELEMSNKTYKKACSILSEYKLPAPSIQSFGLEKELGSIEKIHDSRVYTPWCSNQLSAQRDSCRVMAIDSHDKIVVASLKHPTKGHGLHKMSLLDTLSTDFTPIHNGPIRDIVYSAEKGQILTTSVDKTLKISSTLNNCILQTYNLGYAGWSCDFDPVDPNILYCGLSNDTVMVYDVRNTKESLFSLRNAEITGGAQIHSLHASIIGGKSTLLCANSLKAYMWQSESTKSNTEDDYVCNLLNIETDGYLPFSLSIDPSRQELLLSSRKHGSTKHILASWDDSQEGFSSEWSVQTGIPQRTLARTTFVQRGSQDPALYMEDKDHEVLLIPVGGQIMDIKYSKCDGEEILAALTDNSLHLFKYQ
ncbi:hypothetical protein CLU79DRAFT_830819 [Phycomyces nitens]|nr:hypothetical protein CLU79DRAFT_830819 [Phycomyces nitens]